MRALDAARVDELVARLQRAQRAAPRRARGVRRNRGRARRRCTPRGGGSASSPRSGGRPCELAFEVLPQLERYFDVVVGADDTERHKPDPEPILLALERLGAAPEDAAYVGDSPFDIRAAKAAGVAAIGVTWGGIHSARAPARGGARRARRRRGGAAWRPLRSRRAWTSCAASSSATSTATTSSTTRRSPTPSTTGSSTSCCGSRRSTPSCATPTRPRSASARRPRTGSARSSTCPRWARSRRSRTRRACASGPTTSASASTRTSRSPT